MDSGFEEDLDKNAFATAEEYVRATSKGKMEYMLKKVPTQEFDFIITCDTICVDSDNNIIEKPVRLSGGRGRALQVHQKLLQQSPQSHDRYLGRPRQTRSGRAKRLR